MRFCSIWSNEKTGWQNFSKANTNDPTDLQAIVILKYKSKKCINKTP